MILNLQVTPQQIAHKKVMPRRQRRRKNNGSK
jgi:hypothetical protein